MSRKKDTRTTTERDAELWERERARDDYDGWTPDPHDLADAGICGCAPGVIGPHCSRRWTDPVQAQSSGDGQGTSDG